MRWREDNGLLGTLMSLHEPLLARYSRQEVGLGHGVNSKSVEIFKRPTCRSAQYSVLDVATQVSLREKMIQC